MYVVHVFLITKVNPVYIYGEIYIRNNGTYMKDSFALSIEIFKLVPHSQLSFIVLVFDLQHIYHDLMN